MKCLLVTHVDPVIHGQSLMANLLVRSSETWEEVEISTLNTVYAEHRDGLGSFQIKKLFKLGRYTISTVSRAKHEKMDVIIFTPSFLTGSFCKDVLMMLTTSLLTKSKIVGWVHMAPERLEANWKGRIVRKLGASTLKKIDHWVGCAPKLMQTWPSFMPSTRIPISNGIEDPTSREELEQYRIERKKIRVVYLSAMERAKGWEELFEAAERICRQNENVHFEFYGGVGVNSTKEELQSKFESSHYSQQILWRGSAYAEDKHEAFLGADLFVLPSHTEQFPIVVLEAMAYALPVVATDVGAISDALTNQPLVEVGNVDALELAVKHQIDNLAEAREQGWMNRGLYEERFSAKAFASNWQKLLLSL